jgi:hypothetical protein
MHGRSEIGAGESVSYRPARSDPCLPPKQQAVDFALQPSQRFARFIAGYTAIEAGEAPIYAGSP